MDRLKVITLNVRDLREYANNSKAHDDANVEAIRNSIEAFGMCDPVGVWKNPEGVYEIVEGHGRKLALEQLGYDTVPCIDLSHLTDEERRVYSHVHNQTTLMSELDVEIADLDFDGTEFDMEDFGFEVVAEDEPYEPSGPENIAESSFSYQEQYGVIVMCDSEQDQIETYNALKQQGYKLKVVAV